MQGSMIAFDFTKRELAMLVMKQMWRDSTGMARWIFSFVLVFSILRVITFLPKTRVSQRWLAITACLVAIAASSARLDD